jgi:hypothetical protein
MSGEAASQMSVEDGSTAPIIGSFYSSFGVATQMARLSRMPSSIYGHALTLFGKCPSHLPNRLALHRWSSFLWRGGYRLPWPGG